MNQVLSLMKLESQIMSKIAVDKSGVDGEHLQVMKKRQNRIQEIIDEELK